MNIGIDIMGGDFAPREAIEGVLWFLKENWNNSDTSNSLHFLLFGIEDVVAPYLQLLKGWENSFTFIPCGSFIKMHEHPTKALKEKPDSSISIGYSYLKESKIDAFIGAGNTGAMLVGALYSVKAIEGVSRPTIASPLPKLKGGFNFILDVGANSDCKPEHLLQFAIMGAKYAQHVLKIEKPRVALLNLGAEEGKGNLLAMASYSLMKEQNIFDFVGNIEGRDILSDKMDVMVCDGFTGNIVLKFAEGFHLALTEDRKIQDEFLEQLNYENYGGTPILGINAPVIIGHGISNAKAFYYQIQGAISMVNSEIIEILKEQFRPKMNAEQEK